MEIKKRFVYPDVARVEALAKEAKISKMEAGIFINRGIDTADGVANAKSYTLADLRDPREILDADKAADIISRHIKDGSHIVVYSDYDCDGWGAGVIGVLMLRELGANVNVYTNDRNIGYGAKVEGIDDILSMWPDTKLIITADNGIVAFEAVDYAVSKGIEVVVTDHHQPEETGKLPNASANVNPNRLDDKYPGKNLCGATVLWKVLMLCYFKLGLMTSMAFNYLDIIAVSTIADVVPLVGENRVIVRRGLKLISDDCRPQWVEFKKVFSTFNKITTVDARTVAFSFAPAINAMGRMRGSIGSVIEMFTEPHTQSELEAMAKTIYDTNEERKALTRDQASAASLQADACGDLPVMVITGEEFDDGLVGLIAGRIKEAINRPTIVLTKDENGDWRGSGRSIHGFNLKEVLDRINNAEPGMLVAYGGHELAAGMTIAGDRLNEFRALMVEEGEKIPEENFVRDIVVDYVAGNGEINNAMMDTIRNLEPFGNSFEAPTIMIRDMPVDIVRTMGVNKQHVSFKMKGFSITSWNGAKNVDMSRVDNISTVSAVGRLERDDWGIKLMVEPDEFEVKYD